MKNNSILMFALLIVFAFAAGTASAQFPITIPKIPKLPKIKKDKPQPQQETTPASDSGQSNANQSEDNRASEDEGARQKPDECQTNSIARLVTDELAKMSEDIEAYTPDRGWFYSGSPTYSYLLMSVSPSAMKDWQTKFNTISDCPKIVSGFKRLSTAATKKLPLRMANKAGYAVHNLAEEKLMKSKITDLANHKIFYLGITEPNWLIEKNEYGLPTARYKHGMVWVRYTKEDHPYCRAYYINIVSDYAGGGTYGSSYGNYVDQALVGCPTGN